MEKTWKWTNDIGMSLLLFGAFLMEYVALFLIEMLLLKMDIANYSAGDRSVHHLIMVGIWGLYIGCLLLYSKRKQGCSHGDVHKLRLKNTLIATLCLCGCKVLTFIDWHTLKVIGEAQGKDVVQFIAQYMYYVMEVVIVLLILKFGQQAFERLRGKQSYVPYGGIVLACTWGIFHFVSRGVGIEIWNGISCMVFSILSGVIYLRLERKMMVSYLFIAISYLL